MNNIDCPFRMTLPNADGQGYVCQIVARITDRPLAECLVNDSACRHCLGCGVAPSTPNPVTASMAVGVAQRSGDPVFLREMVSRMKPSLRHSPPITDCVVRGPQIRQVACKPCQADSLTPVLVPVFRCPLHQECTLHNTGLHPRIQACATCADRLERYYQIEKKPHPPEVLQAIKGSASACRSPPL